MTTFAPTFHKCVVQMPSTDENDLPAENGSTKTREWELTRSLPDMQDQGSFIVLHSPSSPFGYSERNLQIESVKRHDKQN